MEGWIKLYRQIIFSDIYQMPPLYLRVFERLIIEANYQDIEIPYKKKGGKIASKKLIKRGERLTSIRDICKWVAWYERGKEVIPNCKTVQNILEWLSENDMIKIYGFKSNRTETHYKIVNYSDYQDTEDEEVTDREQSVYSSGTESIQSLDTNKKDKNNNIINNINNIYSTFEKKPEEKAHSDAHNAPKNKKGSKAKKVFSNEHKEYLLAKYLSKEISERLNVPLQKEDTLQKWSYEFEKMVRLDGIDIDDIKDVLVFSQEDEFWQTNILSAGKFRKQYLALLAKMRKEEKT